MWSLRAVSATRAWISAAPACNLLDLYCTFAMPACARSIWVCALVGHGNPHSDPVAWLPLSTCRAPYPISIPIDLIYLFPPPLLSFPPFPSLSPSPSDDAILLHSHHGPRLRLLLPRAQLAQRGALLLKRISQVRVARRDRKRLLAGKCNPLPCLSFRDLSALTTWGYGFLFVCSYSLCLVRLRFCIVWLTRTPFLLI